MDENLKLNTAIGAEITLPLAGAGSRSYAYIVDWHIRIVAVLVWFVLWLASHWPVDLGKLGDNQASLLWLVLPSSILYLLYHPVLELIMQGNSPGKRWVGLSCVDTSGNTPSNGAILLRNIMRMVDSLPLLYTVGVTCIIFSQRQQRFGDMVANTQVVYAMEDGSEALAKLDKIENAKIDPQEAELLIEILERWSTLKKPKRRALAEALLQRSSIVAETNDRALKRQLEALLG